eukprot:1156540-Pelagomonas_calceolata.AAC.4
MPCLQVGGGGALLGGEFTRALCVPFGHSMADPAASDGWSLRCETGLKSTTSWQEATGPDPWPYSGQQTPQMEQQNPACTNVKGGKQRSQKLPLDAVVKP